MAAICIIYLLGAFVDIMEVDAAQYASMSLEMMNSGNYLEIHHRSNDYLDKPPLLFWLTSICFQLLGVSNFTYKLPSILFTLLGIFSTYRLGRKLYDEQTAKLSAIFLGSCQAMILINNDVRTDTMLTGALAFALWQWVEYFDGRKWKHLVLGALGMAAAMLTKGPIGLMLPVLAIGSEFLIKGNLRRVLDPKLLVAVVLVAVMLIPMCVGLYTQHGTEGLKFYFWTQSFGRLTGENVWANDEGPLFFVETFLWSFLPWTLLGGFAVLQRYFFLFRDGPNSRKQKEYYTIGGITLVFVAMSLSKYKLQHYVFIVYPLIAILGAHFMVRLKKHRIWTSIQNVVASLILLLIGVLSIYSFESTWITVGVLVMGVGFFVWSLINSSEKQKLWFPSVVAMVTAGVLLNGSIYPQLLQYQSSSVAGKWIKERDIQPEQLRAFGDGGHALDFYSGIIIKWDSAKEYDLIRTRDTLYVFTNPSKYEKLRANYGEADEVIAFPHFKVQFMKLPFLIPERRHEVLTERYILKYYPLSAERASQAIRPEPISSALSSMSKVGV